MSVTPNIEKHAGAPLYPIGLKHPYPGYSHLNRLEIDLQTMDKDIKEIFLSYEAQANMENRNPLDYIKVCDIKCKCDAKILYEQLFGYEDDQPNEVMAYKSCKHTLFAAAKRQMKAAPTPDNQVADDFLEYSKQIINEEVGEELTHFGYSFQDWYNHLNYAKQKDMDLVAKYLIDKTVLTYAERAKVEQENYEGICKIELQGVNGKPRMVCSIPLMTKYAMGPVCWQLEEIFAHKFKGYCGGKNLTQMSNMINEYIDQGFTKVVEGDGSAFDNTQDITLKRVDHYIYERVAHAVYHVDRERFLQIATSKYKVMDLMHRDPITKKRIKLFTYKILGSVFSGDADTTLCNTIRMALYNRFVNDRAGLKYGVDYVCFSKGDDFTVMYKPHVSDEFINNTYYKYFLKANPNVDEPDTRQFGLGQVLKMLDIGGPEIIKFCSLRAWPVDSLGHIVLTRDPAKFTNLSKYSRRTKVMNKFQLIKYLLEQSIALTSSYQGLKYFDAMANAYLTKAKFILKSMKISKHEERALVWKISSQLSIDRRKDKSPYHMQENELEHIVYNIKHRIDRYKIQHAYWETMKLKERIHTQLLNESQLKYANQAMSMEFKVEELKSALGLINAI